MTADTTHNITVGLTSTQFRPTTGKFHEHGAIHLHSWRQNVSLFSHLSSVFIMRNGIIAFPVINDYPYAV